MQTSVLIAGLGLIGGSIAASIRSAHPNVKIIGFDQNRKATEEGLRRQIIDESAENFGKGASAADVIILAAPVSVILSMIKELEKTELRPGAIVTDVGSTKRLIELQADNSLKGRCHFIGGHPMAGSHKSGVSAARANLFENAYYFLIAEENQEPAPIEKLEHLLSGTHAKFFRVTPETHDQIVGLISHFPHLIASALVHHLENHPIEGINLRLLAAGGFRDITRIASSDPTMWTDTVMSNRDDLLKLLEEWTQSMEQLKNLLAKGNGPSIYEFFRKAKVFRDGFPKKEKGAIPAYYDLFIDIPDRPDTISTVTGYIGRAGINLTNIEIIEARENNQGIMRLTFQEASQRDRAHAILRQKGYHTYLND
ncbi:prephenate dehydrogenase [Sporolactobacillus sp. KGMB 08714]|uniref:prephenate dehydrogenase n=1 Tax=Sporolactobacillus sp. KGMB 08714 TaxID=3064704 RepID=UPI002FBE1677